MPRESDLLCPHCGYDLRSGKRHAGTYFCPECGRSSSESEIALSLHRATDRQVWLDFLLCITPAIAFTCFVTLDAALDFSFLNTWVVFGLALSAAGVIGYRMTWRSHARDHHALRTFQSIKSAIAVAALNFVALIPAILILALTGQ